MEWVCVCTVHTSLHSHRVGHIKNWPLMSPFHEPIQAGEHNRLLRRFGFIYHVKNSAVSFFTSGVVDSPFWPKFLQTFEWSWYSIHHYMIEMYLTGFLYGTPCFVFGFLCGKSSVIHRDCELLPLEFWSLEILFQWKKFISIWDLFQLEP